VTETKAKLEASGQQPAAAGTDAIEQRLATAVDQLQKEKLLAARALARKVLDDPACEAFGGVWLRAAELISQVNTALLSSDVPAPEKTAYIIQSGDTLVGIAQRHNTTVPALQRGNRLDPISPVIHAGAVLHIYRAQWELRILKERFLLLLLDGETLVKLYRVGTGRQDRTPVGVFRVATKQQEPVWTPAGRVIPFGDPRNVLGTRWLGLEPIEGTDVTLKGFGIHGTWEPETVGAAASEGCVRMHNEDVNELFDIVPLGARVVIEGE
jgi:lipoprotein-anchoring transpeptidase ErfK/SrfK